MTYPLAPHRTILLVEDDDAILTCIEGILRGEGYTVMTAKNGKEALLALRSSEPPDLILLDLLMPVMDGWKFLEQMRQDHPALSSVPIIAISSGGQRLRPNELKISELLEKPLDLESLISTVARHSATQSHSTQFIEAPPGP